MNNTIEEAFTRHRRSLDEAERTILPQVEAAAELICETLRAGRTIVTCGNGGSAADAQHFAAEWMCKYKDDRRPLPAVALTVDTSAITAIGNDYGFEAVFERQVRALGREGDLFVAFTTSGASRNVLRALAAAKEKKMKTILLTGEKGKGLVHEADLVIAVPTAETARIQEIHELIYHAWCEYFDRAAHHDNEPLY